MKKHDLLGTFLISFRTFQEKKKIKSLRNFCIQSSLELSINNNTDMTINRCHVNQQSNIILKISITINWTNDYLDSLSPNTYLSRFILKL